MKRIKANQIADGYLSDGIDEGINPEYVIADEVKAEIAELVDMLEMLMSSGLMENETQGYTYCEVTEDEYRESLRLIAKYKGE